MSAVTPIADKRGRGRIVRFGSKADMAHADHYVRFTPESGHWRAWSDAALRYI